MSSKIPPNFSDRSALEGAFSRSSEPAALIDDGGEVTWCNDSFSKLFLSPSGSSSGSILPINLAAFLTPSDRERLLAVSHFEAFEVLVSSARLGLINQTAVVIVLGNEILESNTRLLQFQSKAAPDRALNRKSEVLATIAHDLKTPLSAVFGYADTLLDTTLGDTLSDAQRHILSRIRATAARATELVRNYQHLAQLDLDGLKRATSDIELNSTVSDVVSSVWRQDGIEPEIELNLSPQRILVRVERLHVDRIISNLVTNALKFADQGSTISIKVTDGDGYPQLSVTNIGSAILNEEMNLLFQPFSRLSNSKGKPGSGLGLTIVQRICSEIGARVTVKSTLISSAQQEKGPSSQITFTVVFPSANSTLGP